MTHRAVQRANDFSELLNVHVSDRGFLLFGALPVLESIVLMASFSNRSVAFAVKGLNSPFCQIIVVPFEVIEIVTEKADDHRVLQGKSRMDLAREVGDNHAGS